MRITMDFPRHQERYGVAIHADNGFELSATWPACLSCLHAEEQRLRYDSVQPLGGSFLCTREFSTFDGSCFELKDRWIPYEQGVCLERTLCCLKGDGTAVRISSEFECRSEAVECFGDYRFVVPGAFYGLNDNDCDGLEDYLGTYTQDYRDDRNPGLYALCYAPGSGSFAALLRTDIPESDPLLTHEQVRARHFAHDTQIGSLGFGPSERRLGGAVLRMDYPFFERNSFCLNVDGSGWSAYRPMPAGSMCSAHYRILLGHAKTLTDAAWTVTCQQMDNLLNDDIQLPFTLAEAEEERIGLIAQSYREFPRKKGFPAGYFMHFSPRKRLDGPNILEYGFSGAQTLNAYTMLRASRTRGVPLWREQAIQTIDFFVNHCIAPSGIPHGIYDIDRQAFIYWWTGVLFPFQYAKNREELEQYVGWQVVTALQQVADALRSVDGNYCRTMVEAMNYLLLAYIDEREAGFEHDDWLAAVRDFCDWLVSVQWENGAWSRGYTMDGYALTEPPEWFGRSALERGSGAIFPCELLTRFARVTGEARYLKSACAAADFILQYYVPEVRYVGGLNDTTHIKSVKIDSVGVMFSMRSLLLCYECSGEARYLRGAWDAARILSTWVFLWDVPFDGRTLLGRFGFKTTGWAGCDVIPAAGYVDDEFPEFVPDLLRVAEYTGDRQLGRFAKIVTLGMHHGLSMPQRMYDYALPGVQCEGYMTSLWLSDMQDCSFSGAVAKMKGDDNDTCNGLINAQAVYNLDEVRRRYGTLDFDAIIATFREPESL